VEQLTGQAIESLVRIARGRPASPALWKQKPPRGEAAERLDHLLPEGLACDTVSAAPAPGQGTPALQAGSDAPLIGIERRLARRAEALWDALRGAAPMPDASAAAALLGPPFSGHAMLLKMPPASAPQPAQQRLPAAPALPHISFVGEALASLAVVFHGPVVPDARPVAPLDARFAALAQQAVATQAPAPFDSEGSPARSGAGRQTPLLMRAIALPCAPAGSAGHTVVIIVSWRELLSADETDALHRELAAAIGWMHAHKISG